MHDAVRLLTGSAADFLDDYFESDILKGYLASSGIIGTKVGPMSQGSGLVLLFHSLGEHDGHFGSWAFHKGGNGGFTQVLARAAAGLRRGDPPRRRRRLRHHQGGRAPSASRSRTAPRSPRHDRRVSALDPRRTFTQLVEPRELPSDLVENINRMKFQGTSAKVNFALDAAAAVSRARRPHRTSTAGSPTSGRRWSTSSGPSTTRSTAGTASGPTSTAPSSRPSTRTWRLPAST